jgi:hypothetical protein
MRQMSLFLAAIILFATIANSPVVVAQEHRTSERESDPRVDGMLKLNERLIATIEHLAARVETLERAHQRLGQQADSVSTLEVQVRDLNSEIHSMRAQLETIQYRVDRLESQRVTVPIAEKLNDDQARLDTEGASSPEHSSVDRDETASRFSYRGRAYANYEAFKSSPEFLDYQEENRQAAQRFQEHLQEQERRRQAADDVLRHRRQYLVKQINAGKLPGRL